VVKNRWRLIMKVNYQSVNFNADQKLLDFIQKKLDKLDVFYDHIVDGHVYLRVEGSSERDNKVCEIKLNIPGKDLMATKQCKSFEEAADLSVEALRRALVKHKEKVRS